MQGWTDGQTDAWLRWHLPLVLDAVRLLLAPRWTWQRRDWVPTQRAAGGRNMPKPVDQYFGGPAFQFRASPRCAAALFAARPTNGGGLDTYKAVPICASLLGSH
jgi:hypothetical protein